MVRWLVGLLFLGMALAGCVGGAKSDSTTTTDAASDVHVAATATTGVIRGLVVDSAIRPLVGVHVQVQTKDQRLSTNTTPNGSFGFQGLAPGTYFVAAEKLGYKTQQTSVEVVAGENTPKIARIQLEANPSTKPYVETLSFKGFLACGVAVFATSIGCSIYPPIADETGTRAIFHYSYTQLPDWMQGELIWDQTQPAGGDLIWEAVIGGSNTPVGYRETTGSPALLYWNTTVFQKNNESVMKSGVDVRFFGGPHPLCKPDVTLPPPSPVANPFLFGCGVTLNQDVKVIVDTFYHFVPPPGWRHTKDGDITPPA